MKTKYQVSSPTTVAQLGFIRQFYTTYEVTKSERSLALTKPFLPTLLIPNIPLIKKKKDLSCHR